VSVLGDGAEGRVREEGEVKGRKKQERTGSPIISSAPLYTTTASPHFSLAHPPPWPFLPSKPLDRNIDSRQLARAPLRVTASNRLTPLTRQLTIAFKSSEGEIEGGLGVVDGAISTAADGEGSRVVEEDQWTVRSGLRVLAASQTSNAVEEEANLLLLLRLPSSTLSAHLDS
jgi:hypothetical protein